MDSEDEEERREEFSWARDAGAGRRRRQMEEEEREEKEREREWAMEEEKEDEDEEGGDYYAVLNVGRNVSRSHQRRETFWRKGVLKSQWDWADEVLIDGFNLTGDDGPN